MKVFGCKRQGDYSGGVILVAAHSIEEAFKVASTSPECEYLFDAYAHDKHRMWLASKDDPDAIIVSDTYPIENWKEYKRLSCDCDEPAVILQEGYSE